MRLNWFLPRLDPDRRRRTPLRRVLGRLGRTWLASPWQRIVQTVAFLVFLVLFFYVCWPYGSPGYADTMHAREIVPAESFLELDPLVGVSAAIAARAWVGSLAWAGVLVAVCLVVPRGFCAYLCPMGTLVDLADWAVGRRITRLRLPRDGWWVHLRYYVLAAVVAAAVGGVMLSGFVAAIPVVTRGLVFILGPVQLGVLKGWYLVPSLGVGHYVSIGLFVLVVGLGLLRPRFWCRHVCPTGAVFSLANTARVTDRKVTDACIACGACRKICPFDAIEPGFATKPLDCTFCQACGGVCPVGAIQFVGRWQTLPALPAGAAASGGVPLSRRGFLGGTAAAMGTALGVRTVFGRPTAMHPIRPPGSVPEPPFLERCVRCGLCFKACPNSVLQPVGFELGLDGLWTPQAMPDWAGCDASCNICGQVCPTGAIRPLPLEEKRVARMGQAGLDLRTCLPHANREACRMCVDECDAAGYRAIELMGVHAEVDETGQPIEGTGFLAPVVVPERCTGCGLCQTRCYAVNARQRGVLTRSAIRVEAGPGKEDRLATGSYRALRNAEQRHKEAETETHGDDTYLPDFIKGP